MENTNNFDSVANNYDSTREIPMELLKKLFETLMSNKIINKDDSILDIGCGTGQISEYLITNDFRVAMSDVSEEMIKVCKNKFSKFQKVTYSVDDARHIEFGSEQFDVIVSSKLFQHIGEWQKAVEEIKRIHKMDGYFIYFQHKDFFNNSIRKYFRNTLTAEGYKPNYPGEINWNIISKFFKSVGYNPIELKGEKLSWVQNFTYEECFRNLKNRLHAEFWNVPEAVYDSALQKTEKMIEASADGFKTIEVKHPYIEVAILKKANKPITFVDKLKETFKMK